MNLHFLKAALVALLLFWQIDPPPTASPKHLRYERALSLQGGPATGQACAALDAQAFAHSATSLKDLRLYRGQTEVPYATTLSEPTQQDSEDARILNLGLRSGHIVLDLEMPHRPYSSVALDLDQHDFIATAEVTGSSAVDSTHLTHLGSFTLFDLTGQHLSHSTTIPLSESSLAYLHIELALSPAPGNPSTARSLNLPAIVKAASVPPSREAQTVYTTLQQSASVAQHGRESVATFQVPIHIPIERIAFALDPSFKGNFSREVRITAKVVPDSKPDPADASGPAAEDETIPANEEESGSILRVHAIEDGHDLAKETLSFPASIGSNMQRPATLEVAVENGDDAPLPIASVSLQMRQRRICFDASTAAGPLTLYYGDSALESPTYDYAKLFRPLATPLIGTLGPESTNPAFTSRSDMRPFTERHPELLWIVLLAVICVLAVTAIRSAKKLPR